MSDQREESREDERRDDTEDKSSIIDDGPVGRERPSSEGEASSAFPASAREVGASADDLHVVETSSGEEEDEDEDEDEDETDDETGDAEASGELILTPKGLLPRREAPALGERSSRTLRVGSTGPLKEVESLVAAGQWGRICEELGDPESIREFPPALQIIYGIACKESAQGGGPTSDTDKITIEAVAALFGVAKDSPMALVVAKRALRSKRPWVKQEAPRGPLAYLLLALGLGLGGLVGWLATFYL